MQITPRFFLLLVFGWSNIFKVDGKGMNLGICGESSEDCLCGGPNGYRVFIRVPECTYFYRWKPYCKPCDNIKKEVRCASYAKCQECNGTVDGCVRCPPNRYGKWCTAECTCQNGGICEQHTGSCICPPQFQGIQCEKTAICKSPELTSRLKHEPQLPFYPIGATVTYSCNDGEFLEGVQVSQCTVEAKWSSSPPKCIRQCPFMSAPNHGTLNLPNLANGRLSEGVSITYSCDDNYRLIGDTTRICQANGEWSGKEPVCEEFIICPKPTEIEFGKLSIQSPSAGEHLTPGTTVTYTCNEDYALVGPKENLCRANGNWSTEAPICAHKENVCFHPGPLKNGVIRPHDKKDLETFLQGTVIEFFCDPLHYMVGNTTAVCGPNNTWSIPKPSCYKLTTCTSLEHLANGRMDIYKPDAKLIANSGKFRMVNPPVRFLSSAKSEEEEWAMYNTELPEDHFHVGTRIVFACESRYYDLVGSRIRTCMTNGQWSGRQPTCIPVCGRSSGPRVPFISHGTPTEIGQWPWQVGIARRLPPDHPLGNWWLMCGGALISERWVATAAHCVTYKLSTEAVPKEEFQLYFGKYYRNDSKDDANVQIGTIEDIHIHADYEPTTFESDIALLRLSKPVQFTSRVQVVCLPSEDPHDSNLRLKEGNLGVLTGWGKTETGNFSEVLMDTQVPVVNNEQCEEDYKKAGILLIVTHNMFCAGHNEGLYDSCGGDSGGPLVFPSDERKDRWILEGIVSWGSPEGCGKPRQHGGYVRVQRFIDWIHQYI